MSRTPASKPGRIGHMGFDDEIERSAAPVFVRAALERMVEADPDLLDRLREDDRMRRSLLAVVAASRSLTRLLEGHPDARGILADLDARPPVDNATVEHLVHWKHLEYLRIAARDLTGLDDLEATGQALTRLAIDVLESACAMSLAEGLAVIGMGKLGGQELNYSSDIDVVFVSEGRREDIEPLARQVMGIAKQCFRVDANLRPEGRDGPLVRSIDSYEAYWDRWAEPWEFQALLKAMPVAGDAALGRRWHDTAQRWLWSRPFSADDLRSLRTMKRRAEAEVTKRGLADREIKRGPGGIRDIEFTVQLLQLVHGHSDPALRSPNTLATLRELAAADYIGDDDANLLGQSYRFYRAVEHRLQLVDDQQVHTLPTNEAAVDQLARVLGYRDSVEGTAVERLRSELRRRQVTVRSIHERIYFRPLLEAFAGATEAMSPEAAVERLTAFGFTDAKRTQAAVRELTRGLNRSSRLMQQLLPLLLDWLSTSPDPDLGLLMLRNLFGTAERTRLLVEAFRDSAEVAQRLCTLVGTSRLLGDTIAHNPDLVARLPYEERLLTLPRDQLVASARAAIAWRGELADRQEALRRWKDRHLLGIAARDIFGHASLETVGEDLTRLAEATLEAALASLDPRVPFAVIGMGRFGGAELSYPSDLDVLFVYEGTSTTATEEASRVATRLVRFVGGSTPAERIFEVDADLRPEGKQGPLARSFDGFLSYWRDYAQTWERQAMVRARPVAGDRDLAERLLGALEPRVWGTGLTPDEVLEIRRMKARVENERIPPGEDPLFHLKLGRGSLSDVEFTAQMLQLRSGVRATGTLPALAALERADVLDGSDADVLAEAYRYCGEVRNRWFLVNSAPSDSLPTQPEPLRWLARSLDTTPTELRERYRRVTRRARRVVERVFYGQQG
ncbi:bifunctional [glutamine synthetase] adenylyltransferase/[glutamine synthetase]-adenylyl-L-tyrosine phosphorylase [Rhabdothermincola sp.]|uniref:bifunctional [glutamine synthetase] adenylyltransferase/[glutamine synthetase]-adenylyl-L-tyrosine phosphorylase n=1 Tax=Rhabdothermincola sp. TaxID=2820405 RepID=UPI002FE124E6